MSQQPPSGGRDGLVREAKRRAENLRKVDFRKLAFAPQLDFITDDARRVVACCGRRAGKTQGLALKLIRRGFLFPYCQVFYVTLSRPQAKRVLWPILKEIDRDIKLGCKFGEGDLTCTLPNGSRIVLGGANDEAETQRYRGVKSPLFVLDEAQAFKWYIKSLVEEICIPALTDYGRIGQIVMTGTPNATSHGYFYDASSGSGEIPWSSHHWTMLDNPHLKDVRETFEEEAAKYRLGQQDPRFRREYLGEWVRDADNCVFNLSKENLIQRPPEEVEDWRHVLGMDIGYTDATALVVLAYSPTANKVVALESLQESKMDLTRAVVEVDKLNAKYNFESIVVDPGGGGKFHIEEIKKRLGLPAKAAQKTQKVSAIEFLNMDIRNRSFSIVERNNGELIEQLFTLRWNLDRVKDRYGGFQPTTRLTIDDHDPDHLADALLYAHRECSHWLAQYKKASPTPGTKQYWAAEEAKLRQWQINKAKERLRTEEDPFGFGY